MNCRISGASENDRPPFEQKNSHHWVDGDQFSSISGLRFRRSAANGARGNLSVGLLPKARDSSVYRARLGGRVASMEPSPRPSADEF